MRDFENSRLREFSNPTIIPNIVMYRVRTDINDAFGLLCRILPSLKKKKLIFL